MALSSYQRIKLVLNYYYKMGANKESVNKVYYSLLKVKYNKYGN